MSNLIQISGRKKEKTPLGQAIYDWFVNLFHVHKYEDEDKVNTQTNGVRSGWMIVQICEKCGDRRTQLFTAKGRIK